MRKLILTIFTLSLTTSLATSLTACSNQTLPSAQINQVNQIQRPGVQTLRAPATSPVRSNTVLDAVAKRLRFVSFQLNDRDRNGQLSPQEFQNVIAGLPLTQFDTNKDGQLNFNEFDKAMQGASSIFNRNALRSYAQLMWSQVNTDQNLFVLRSEVEAYFTAPYNQPGQQPVISPPDSNPDIPAYPQANGDQLKFEARKQAIDFFVQADVNLDQKLSFSEYEDGVAKQMLSSSENNLSNNYGAYYPSPNDGTGYGTGYGYRPDGTLMPNR